MPRRDPPYRRRCADAATGLERGGRLGVKGFAFVAVSASAGATERGEWPTHDLARASGGTQGMQCPECAAAPAHARILKVDAIS